MFGLGQAQLIGLALLLGAIGALMLVNRGLANDIAARDVMLGGYSLAITASNDALTQYESDKAAARAKQQAAVSDAEKIADATALRVRELMERHIPQDCAGAMQALRLDAPELALW